LGSSLHRIGAVNVAILVHSGSLCLTRSTNDAGWLIWWAATASSFGRSASSIWEDSNSYRMEGTESLLFLAYYIASSRESKLVLLAEDHQNAVIATALGMDP
jgi:hypothetical protein